MELTRINDVVERFGLSSRTLRYYEQAGILWSYRPDQKAQRYYDQTGLERLKQIIVLRKLQIPIKDIAAIYKDDNTSTLIQAFVDKLDSLDDEITALSELRRLVDDFLQKMLLSGIKRISAITLLYEETQKRIASDAKDEPVTYERLEKISRNALRLHDVRIIRLPAIRVLTSRMKDGALASLDGDGLQNLFAEYGIVSTPGLRECFLVRQAGGEWMMLAKVPNDFENASPYRDKEFAGGLYAVASSFMEDIDDTFALLREWIERSENFEPDTDGGGALARDELLEEIMPWDIAERLSRYQQDIMIPIKLKKGMAGNE